MYEARDAERRQRVALKALLHYDAASLFLLKQEFRTLADVQHRNLVRLYELVAGEGERVFFSMELVRGGTFLAYVRKSGRGTAPSGHVETSDVLSAPSTESGVHMRSTPPPAAASASPGKAHVRLASPADLDRLRPALRQLVQGVQAPHSAGKVHRDIKPPNVLVTPEGRVVVLDFGVSTDMPRVADENLREEMQWVGTARYMAPEQALGEPTTPASDWYSVGVMLYEALAGRAPFEGSTYEVIAQKSTTDARPPSAWADGIPPDFDAMCVALLDADPARRPTGTEYSAWTSCRCCSPSTKTWSRHSLRTLPRKRSHTAFARGARTGVLSTLGPPPSAARSKSRPNLSSRSRMMKRGPIPDDVALRICCATHA
ncbi:MAG TPA: serine/threonine-protein kinase, partial [Polyangiaceae bacterium]|nr:serine/threonine-protein kinase [Polyangiaceae bacterium]